MAAGDPAGHRPGPARGPGSRRPRSVNGPCSGTITAVPGVNGRGTPAATGCWGHGCGYDQARRLPPAGVSRAGERRPGRTWPAATAVTAPRPTPQTSRERATGPARTPGAFRAVADPDGDGPSDAIRSEISPWTVLCRGPRYRSLRRTPVHLQSPCRWRALRGREWRVGSGDSR